MVWEANPGGLDSCLGRNREMQGGLSQRREPEQRLILQDLWKGARLFKTGSKASSDKRIPRGEQ